MRRRRCARLLAHEERPTLEPPSPEPEPEPIEAEDRIIQRVLGAARQGKALQPPLVVPPGDDGAVLHDGTVITLDLLVEGVHWNDRLSAADVGFKAVAVNVSDVAAMGGTPSWMVLGLGVRGDEPWVAEFAIGLGEAAHKWGVHLIGGDTVSTAGPRTVAIQMAGHVIGAPLRRSGAKPGDHVLVSGVLGLAGAGYLHDSPHAAALAALRRPQPCPGLATALSTVAHAAMDISDGLLADLPRLCAASGVGALIDPSKLPSHPGLFGDGPDARTLQLAAGDDYELLITVPPHALQQALDLGRAHGVRLTQIGTITDDLQCRLSDGAWPSAPWRHFQRGQA